MPKIKLYHKKVLIKKEIEACKNTSFIEKTKKVGILIYKILFV